MNVHQVAASVEINELNLDVSVRECALERVKKTTDAEAVLQIRRVAREMAKRNEPQPDVVAN